MTQNQYGFGFHPDESQSHFYVILPQKGGKYVEIFERNHWEETGEQVLGDGDILKARVPKETWIAIAGTVSCEFNRWLKKEGQEPGKFKPGGVPIKRLMGKELMVLVWALENSNPSKIPTALTNWLGLQPEDRWWLYTMTNASTGSINDSGRGWRMALQYALCDNPV